VAVEVGADAVEVVGDERAAGATGVLLVDAVSVAEHEVIDEQLRAAVKKLRERRHSVARLEAVFLLDRDPWQFPPAASELVASAPVLLLGSEQLLAGGQPLVSRPHRVVGHRRSPFCRQLDDTL